MNPASATLTPDTETPAGPRLRVGGVGEELQTPVPVRADGVELLGALRGSGYAAAPSLVRRADGQTLQLSPVVYAVLESIDGRRDIDAIAEAVSSRVGKRASAQHVRYLIDEKLRPLGVLHDPNGSHLSAVTANPLLGLRWRFVVTNPTITRRLTAPFAQLFRPWVAIPLLVAFAAVSVWVLMEKGLASATHQAMYEPGMLLAIFALTMLSAGFHEFGHAAGCRYGGATPGAMGVGLYLVWPAFYTEVSDSYRLDRAGRLRVDVGGLYFNAIFALGMAGLWAATQLDAILLLIPAQLFQMLRQLLPFVRFDGYHILADLTGVPDLFSHLKPTVLAMLPGRWRRPAPQALKRWARAVVTAWVLLVIPILLLSLFMMVKVLPRVVATAWDSMSRQWAVLQVNAANADAAAVAVGVLSLITVALPVASMVYLLSRVVRRTVRKVWRATAGKPRLRAASILAAAGLVALLAWLWWPEGQYEPIRGDERADVIGGIDPSPTLTLAPTRVAAAGTAVALPALPAPSSAPVEVVDGHVPAAFAGAEPKPALVLQPVDDPDAPPTIIVLPEPEDAPVDDQWPFPFNRPRTARPQDNQALAVNTVDGSTLYDVSVALVWVTDGDVDERNDAYALASCRDCTTVAVAFQVVFVLGRTDVIVPQNVSIAVNHACRGCNTFALAVQLVAKLADVPSAKAMARIEAVWAEVEAFAANIDDIPLDELTARVTAFEAAIVQILIEEDGASETEDDAALSGDEPTPTVADAAIAEEDALEPAVEPTPEAAATDAPSGTTTTEATEAYTEPAPVLATSEPAPEPSEEAPATAEPAPAESAPAEPAPSEPAPEEPAPAPSPDAEPTPSAEPPPTEAPTG